jgi:protein-S-isoprenylcysteine O-methyltransferase Ste14
MTLQSVMNALITSLACVLVLVALIPRVWALTHGQWVTASGPILFYTLMFLLFVFRHASKTSLTSLKHYFFALAGTFLPLLMEPGSSPQQLLVILGWGFQIIGMVVTNIALGSLGRGFGIFAANRQIKTSGLYQFIRHPLYAGEALWFFALVLMNWSPFNALLYCVQSACQLKRIKDEEQFLLQDLAYQTYYSQVRYRLLPKIY